MIMKTKKKKDGLGVTNPIAINYKLEDSPGFKGNSHSLSVTFDRQSYKRFKSPRILWKHSQDHVPKTREIVRQTRESTVASLVKHQELATGWSIVDFTAHSDGRKVRGKCGRAARVQFYIVAWISSDDSLTNNGCFCFSLFPNSPSPTCKSSCRKHIKFCFFLFLFRTFDLSHQFLFD
ncbi:uncharacterized protein LOC111019109 [Momordica charantia]|uniref:Uncharacterized protein LOC111019109 n=1 Tax=Momordica charantia TaxID=3673 RepID=A0A6J1DA89_MOMCH|nr:uncharacterized protein LOC111019109 [Momordica charantia]